MLFKSVAMRPDYVIMPISSLIISLSLLKEIKMGISKAIHIMVHSIAVYAKKPTDTAEVAKLARHVARQDLRVYLGDRMLVRCTAALVRPSRDQLPSGSNTPMILSLDSHL